MCIIACAMEDPGSTANAFVDTNGHPNIKWQIYVVDNSGLRRERRMFVICICIFTVEVMLYRWITP